MVILGTETFQFLIRERRGLETREEQSRNNSAAMGQGPGSASRDTYNNIYGLFCRTETPI